VSEAETETLELLTHSSAAREAVAHVRKIAHLTGAKTAARAADASLDGKGLVA